MLDEMDYMLGSLSLFPFLIVCSRLLNNILTSRYPVLYIPV
jgi:hypothetical protein